MFRQAQEGPAMTARVYERLWFCRGSLPGGTCTSMASTTTASSWRLFMTRLNAFDAVIFDMDGLLAARHGENGLIGVPRNLRALWHRRADRSVHAMHRNQPDLGSAGTQGRAAGKGRSFGV